MGRYEVKNPLTPEGRNQINSMFEELYKEYTGAGINAKDAREKAVQAMASISEIKKYISVPIKNEAVNGNFEKGTFGWASYTGTSIKELNGKLITTGTGEHSQVRIRQSDGYGLSTLPYYSGHKLFVKGSFTVTNPFATEVGFAIWSEISDIPIDQRIHKVMQYGPVEGTEYIISDVIELHENSSGSVILQLRTQYAQASYSVDKSTEIGNVLVIDLTNTFGAGNEPTKEEMEELLNSYPSGWIGEEGNVGKTSYVALKQTMQNTKKINRLENEVGDYSNLVDIPNGVRNGNFVNSDGWSSLSGTSISVSNNTMNVTGTGDNRLVRAYQITDLPYRAGHKVYVRGEFEMDNDLAKMAGFYLNANGKLINETLFRKTAPKKDEPFVMSGVMTNKDVSGSGNVAVYLRADYNLASEATGKVMKVKKVIAIDLTETFGIGNEPEREELDKMIRFYSERFFYPKPQLNKWQVALTNYTLRKKNKMKEPLIALTIDDGNATDYTTAWGMYKSRGLKGTSYLIGMRMNSNDARWLNTDRIQEMYNDGWDFQCHTFNHGHFADLTTDQEIRAEFELTNQVFAELGLPEPKHHAYPFGSYNRRVIDIGLEYRKSLRATGTTSGMDYNEYDRPTWGALNSRSIDIDDTNVDKIEEIKAIIDKTIEDKGALILYHHQVLDNPGEYETKTEHLAKILDYIAEKVNAGLIKSVTHSELYDIIHDYNKG